MVVLIVGLTLSFGFPICSSVANACSHALTDFLTRFQIWGVNLDVVGYVLLFTSLVNVKSSPETDHGRKESKITR